MAEPMSILNLIPEVTEFSKCTGENHRVAVIGFGKMGVLHSAILSLLEPRCVRCVVDNNWLVAFVALVCSKALGSTERYVRKEDLDVIYVTTLAQVHYSIIACLKLVLGAYSWRSPHDQLDRARRTNK
jgi:hypothetical protein